MSELRVYKKDSKQYELYREMHENQDLRYVKNKYFILIMVLQYLVAM